jgi:GNAT superfamily N-acetyltransferase/ketosteroid isomerase-like protein
VKHELVIRAARVDDLDTVFEIINDSARAYQGVIPAAAWREPYMPMDHLQSEIAKGVRFYCCDLEGRTMGVMGIQDVQDVTLIRHAYVRSQSRSQGIGRALLEFATRLTSRPVLIGAWRAASWAIQFYQKNGFTLLDEARKNRLLGTYWTISSFQTQESIVLADRRWWDRESSTVLHATYERFNARDIDGALSLMSHDVIWPNGMAGGTVHGHEGIRAYWTRQWKVVDPRVTAQSITRESDGRYAVEVYQLVKDMAGVVLLDRTVHHVYRLDDGLIASMEVRE